MKNNDDIREFFKKNAFIFSAWVLSLLTLVLNTWITLKLVPISERFIRVENRVEAIETRNIAVDPLVVRFLKLEESFVFIKEAIIRIESKVDKLLGI